MSNPSHCVILDQLGGANILSWTTGMTELQKTKMKRSATLKFRILYNSRANKQQKRRIWKREDLDEEDENWFAAVFSLSDIWLGVGLHKKSCILGSEARQPKLKEIFVWWTLELLMERVVFLPERSCISSREEERHSYGYILGCDLCLESDEEITWK